MDVGSSAAIVKLASLRFSALNLILHFKSLFFSYLSVNKFINFIIEIGLSRVPSRDKNRRLRLRRVVCVPSIFRIACTARQDKDTACEAHSRSNRVFGADFE